MKNFNSGIFRIEIVETKRHSMLISSNSLKNAHAVATVAMGKLNKSNSTPIEGTFKRYIDTKKTTTINELSTEESLKILNQDDTLYVHVDSTKLTNLASMFDPSDPGHTRGDSDYFIDQLTNMIIERPEDKASIMSEILYIAKYITIIVYD